MRIGVIVDGQSEFDALPRLFPQLERAAGCILIGPVKADIQPKAPIPVIARACRSRIAVLQGREVDSIVVTFDRENLNECPGELAELVRQEIVRTIDVPLAVVIKDRAFENWLVSDCDALTSQRQRYALSRAAIRSVSPNKADQVDAYRFLQNASQGDDYNKVRDSIRILEHADPLRMAGNSRSFRRFLRCIGHPNYAEQSRSPAR